MSTGEHLLCWFLVGSGVGTMAYLLVLCWRWRYGRQIARRLVYLEACERAWRLRVTVDGERRVDLTLAELRGSGRAGIDLGIHGARLTHVSLSLPPPPPGAP